jgi:hypothetical protein
LFPGLKFQQYVSGDVQAETSPLRFSPRELEHFSPKSRRGRGRDNGRSSFRGHLIDSDDPLYRSATPAYDSWIDERNGDFEHNDYNNDGPWNYGRTHRQDPASSFDNLHLEQDHFGGLAGGWRENGRGSTQRGSTRGQRGYRQDRSDYHRSRRPSMSSRADTKASNSDEQDAYSRGPDTNRPHRGDNHFEYSEPPRATRGKRSTHREQGRPASLHTPDRQTNRGSISPPYAPEHRHTPAPSLTASNRLSLDDDDRWRRDDDIRRRGRGRGRDRGRARGRGKNGGVGGSDGDHSSVTYGRSPCSPGPFDRVQRTKRGD